MGSRTIKEKSGPEELKEDYYRFKQRLEPIPYGPAGCTPADATYKHGAGPFRFGTGGGCRVIKDTKTHS